MIRGRELCFLADSQHQGRLPLRRGPEQLLLQGSSHPGIRRSVAYLKVHGYFQMESYAEELITLLKTMPGPTGRGTGQLASA